MDPLAIAAEILRRDRSDFAAPERIKNGLTNESWLVRADDIAVVVRLSHRNTAALQIDRHSEANILRAVADAGIGARVMACVPERHFLVTQYIQGATWNARDVRLQDNIKRVAGLLKALHTLPIPNDVQTVDLRKIVCEYWNTLMSRGLGANAGTPEVRERARQLIAHLADNAESRLCHSDVHHLNIVDDGRLRLIDWEYAGSGDPYFDLASVCCYHSFSNDARRELLRAYLGEDNSVALERLQRMCWVFNYIRDLWFAVREME